MRRAVGFALVLACGCGAELKLGEKSGLKPVIGDAHVTLDERACGMPLQVDGYTATSQPVGNDCRFTFERDVVVATKADYDGDLKNLAGLVKAVELEVRSLSFTDGVRVKDTSLSVNGQVVLTKDDLATLPRTVRLEGAALDRLRGQIEAKQDAIIHVGVTVTVSPPLPKELSVHYEVAPVIVLGPH